MSLLVERKPKVKIIETDPIDEEAEEEEQAIHSHWHLWNHLNQACMDTIYPFTPPSCRPLMKSPLKMKK